MNTYLHTAPDPLISSDLTDHTAPDPLISSDLTDHAAPDPLISSDLTDHAAQDPLISLVTHGQLARGCDPSHAASQHSLSAQPLSTASQASQQVWRAQRLCSTAALDRAIKQVSHVPTHAAYQL